MLGDLGAASMDDHRVHPDVLEQHDIVGEGLAQFLFAHCCTAVLDHNRVPAELPDVGQCLEECFDVRAHLSRSCTPS